MEKFIKEFCEIETGSYPATIVWIRCRKLTSEDMTVTNWSINSGCDDRTISFRGKVEWNNDLLIEIDKYMPSFMRHNVGDSVSNWESSVRICYKGCRNEKHREAHRKQAMLAATEKHILTAQTCINEYLQSANRRVTEYCQRKNSSFYQFIKDNSKKDINDKSHPLSDMIHNAIYNGLEKAHDQIEASICNIVNQIVPPLIDETISQIPPAQIGEFPKDVLRTLINKKIVKKCGLGSHIANDIR
jgi:hypothetical protein